MPVTPLSPASPVGAFRRCGFRGGGSRLASEIGGEGVCSHPSPPPPLSRSSPQLLAALSLGPQPGTGLITSSPASPSEPPFIPFPSSPLPLPPTPIGDVTCQSQFWPSPLPATGGPSPGAGVARPSAGAGVEPSWAGRGRRPQLRRCQARLLRVPGYFRVRRRRRAAPPPCRGSWHRWPAAVSSLVVQGRLGVGPLGSLPPSPPQPRSLSGGLGRPGAGAPVPGHTPPLCVVMSVSSSYILDM